MHTFPTLTLDSEIVNIMQYIINGGPGVAGSLSWLTGRFEWNKC